ncbi:SRPBCC domain-containing protein [Allorhizobium pseudoryzae]|uniref:SRPBCC domain-containing protein n=1 Tax=Allorhizobium pseudoryzae TaxID=379684 RepID=UPI003D00DB34
MSFENPVEIESSRVLAFARDDVFQAFADPALLALWWGPDGFTNEIHRFEFEPGGAWLITMTASNGTDFLNRSTFGEIVVPERITFTHHDPIHVFDMEMRFEVVSDSASRLTWVMRMEPNEDNTTLTKFIALANEQNFDRLERVLEARRNPVEDFA